MDAEDCWGIMEGCHGRTTENGALMEDQRRKSSDWKYRVFGGLTTARSQSSDKYFSWNRREEVDDRDKRLGGACEEEQELGFQ